MATITKTELIDLIRTLSMTEGYLVGYNGLGKDCILEMLQSQTELLAKKLESAQ